MAEDDYYIISAHTIFTSLDHVATYFMNNHANHFTVRLNNTTRHFMVRLCSKIGNKAFWNRQLGLLEYTHLYSRIPHKRPL